MKSAVIFGVLFCVYLAVAVNAPVFTELVKAYKEVQKNHSLTKNDLIKLVLFNDTTDKKMNCIRAELLEVAKMMEDGKIKLETFQKLWDDKDIKPKQKNLYTHIATFCKAEEKKAANGTLPSSTTDAPVEAKSSGLNLHSVVHEQLDSVFSAVEY